MGLLTLGGDGYVVPAGVAQTLWARTHFTLVCLITVRSSSLLEINKRSLCKILSNIIYSKWSQVMIS